MGLCLSFVDEPDYMVNTVTLVILEKHQLRILMVCHIWSLICTKAHYFRAHLTLKSHMLVPLNNCPFDPTVLFSATVFFSKVNVLAIC